MENNLKLKKLLILILLRKFLIISKYNFIIKSKKYLIHLLNNDFLICSYYKLVAEANTMPVIPKLSLIINSSQKKNYESIFFFFIN